MTKALECCLCSQIAGYQENDLIARLLPAIPYARRVMMESDSFAVVPSLGPLVRGHSLLCPKSHIRSLAALDGDLHAEYRRVKVELIRRLREVFRGEVVLFEHGMAATGDRILCSVDHAHMHFLPLPKGFSLAALRQRGWTPFDGELTSLSRLTQGREYIVLETAEGVFWLLSGSDEPLESQYMRKLIAADLGNSNSWNWREAPNPLAANEAWRRFVRHPIGADA